MIYCFDTYYFPNQAKTSCIGISEWTRDTPDFLLHDIVAEVSDYESGAFYKRELPCLISILEKINLNMQHDIIVIDGFVVLDDDGKPGLGAYLHDSLNSAVPIIGVAKSNFATLEKLKREVYRGNSERPLFVTAKGMDLGEAAGSITKMHGNFRIPTILKLVDSYCRVL